MDVLPLAAAAVALYALARPRTATPAPVVSPPAPASGAGGSPPVVEIEAGTGNRAELPLDSDQVYRLAADTIAAYGFNVRPTLATAIAWVESSFRPWVLGDGGTSYGLMQVKLSTARDLFDNFGYRSAPAGAPSKANLLDPRQSLYFGAGYLDWMSRYGGRPQPEDLVIQAYNVGPTAVFQRGARGTAYLEKVRQAEASLFAVA